MVRLGLVLGVLGVPGTGAAWHSNSAWPTHRPFEPSAPRHAAQPPPSAGSSTSSSGTSTARSASASPGGDSAAEAEQQLSLVDLVDLLLDGAAEPMQTLQHALDAALYLMGEDDQSPKRQSTGVEDFPAGLCVKTAV